MAPKLSKKASKMAREAAREERRERKLLEEKIRRCSEKCDEARSYLQPVGRNAVPNFSRAKEALDAAVEIYTENAYAFFLTGEWYRMQNQYEQAVGFYSQALDLDLMYVIALERRALCYQHLHDITHAFEDYSSIIQLEPDNDYAYNMRALCVLNNQVPGVKIKSVDFNQCRDDFKNAIRINEANFYAFANLGKLFEDQGELREALEYYTAALRVNEGYTYALLRRACCSLKIAQNILDNIRAQDKQLTETDLLLTHNKSVSDSNTHALNCDQSSALADMKEIASSVFKARHARENEKEFQFFVNSAATDFIALVNPEMDRNLADPTVLLNLGICSLMLNDLNKAEDYFKQVDEIVAMRPSFVLNGAAEPIDNLDSLLKVLEIQKSKLLEQKSGQAQTHLQYT